jgi:histone chaperone ASF1
VEGVEAAAVDPDAMVEDSEMAGAEIDPAAAEESDDGSEDLEAESSGSEDEAEEEEVEGDEAMEVDGVEKPNGLEHHADGVMAH